MTILTNDLRREMQEAGDGPLRLTDPDTSQEYVLVRAEDYDRMRAVIDGITKRAGWDDPKLDDYETYRKQR